MKPQIAHILLMAVFIVSAPFGPPARAAPDACDQLDWQALGQRDGAKGVANAFNQRSRRCAWSVTGLARVLAPGRARVAYEDGYAAGLLEYCTPDSGYRAGLQNIAYSAKCPATLEAAFVASYRKGLATWAFHNGFDGYWFDGAIAPLDPELGASAPPRPRVLTWRDGTGSDEAEPRVNADGTRDWRELWNRTPVYRPEPPPVAAAPVEPAPVPPHEDRRYRDNDDREDVDHFSLFVSPRLRPRPHRRHHHHDHHDGRDREPPPGVARRDAPEPNAQDWRRQWRDEDPAAPSRR